MKTSKFYAILWLIIISISQVNAKSFWKSNIQYSVLTGANNEVEVIGSEVTTAQISIPAQVTYEGVTYTVTGIGNNALENCACSSIVIPNTIKSIGSSAFKGAQFQSVTVPNTVTIIKKSTFENCNQLSSVTLHNYITRIGNSAFSGCSSLTTLTLPSELTEISEGCFKNSGLSTITVHNKVKYLRTSAFANCASLLNVTLPAELEEIGDSCFYNCGLSSVTFNYNSKLKILHSYAFAYCKTLNSISIPNSVEDIQEKAFYYCEKISRYMSIGDGIKHIGVDAFYETPIYSNPDSYGNVYIGKYALYITNAKEIKNNTLLLADQSLHLRFTVSGAVDTIVVPGSVKYVGEDVLGASYVNAYPYAPKLHIIFSEGTQYIGENVFSVHGGKVSAYVTLPSTIKKIGKIRCYELNWNIPNYPDFTLDNIPTFSTIRFGNNVEHIPAYICYVAPEKRNSYYSSYQPTIYEAENVKSIGDYAFAGCQHIFSFPNSLDSIGEGAFEDNTSFTHLEFPDNVKYIGKYAFRRCSGVTQVDLGTSLKAIEDGVFLSCSSLDHIYIPDNITILGAEAFKNCANLTRLTNPNNSIISIRNNCFQNCVALTSFDIPLSVQTIGSYAFANCTALKTLTWGQNLSALQNGTFAGCSKLTKVELTNNITSIGDSCFYNCVKLSNFKGDSLYYIGSAAFANCSVLKNFTFEDKIKSIGKNIFSGCNALKVFTWNVPNYTFSQYTPFYESAYDIRANIETVHFGNKVETIPQKLCADMRNLKKVFVGSNVNDMNYQQIFGCNSLDEIDVAQENSNLVSKDGVVFSSDTTTLKVYPPAKTGTTYSIPLSVETIAEGAFYNCLKITSMKMENNIQGIEKSAFEGCMKLGSITLGEKVETIGQRAFYNDSILSSITSNANNIPPLTSDVFLYYRSKTHQEIDHTRKMYLYIAEHRKSEYEALPVWKNMIMVTHRAEGIWKVTWKDWDSTTLKEEYVNDGESATPPAEPSRDGYIFTGWDKSFENVTSDLIIKALYKTEGEDLEDVISEGQCTNKILHDGQVYILRGEKIYTLQGQEVK